MNGSIATLGFVGCQTVLPPSFGRLQLLEPSPEFQPPAGDHPRCAAASWPKAFPWRCETSAPSFRELDHRGFVCRNGTRSNSWTVRLASPLGIGSRPPRARRRKRGAAGLTRTVHYVTGRPAMSYATRVLQTHALLGFLFLGFAPCATADDERAIQDWQMQMLLQPTPAQIHMEQRKNRVFIYSRMKDSDVGLAMDQQFGRIQHMMFVNTLVTREREPTPGKASGGEPSGPAVVEEDDGCD